MVASFIRKNRKKFYMNGLQCVFEYYKLDIVSLRDINKVIEEFSYGTIVGMHYKVPKQSMKHELRCLWSNKFFFLT